MIVAQKDFPGIEAMEDFEPVPGVQDEWIMVLRFRDSLSLDEWLELPLRKALIDELTTMLDNYHVNRVQSGFDFWFKQPPGGQPPPAWKQALAVLFCLQPAIVVLILYVSPLLGPIQLSTVNLNLVENTLCVIFMTWLGMPDTDKILQFFLKPPGRHPVRTNILGIGFIALWLAFWSFVWRNY